MKWPRGKYNGKRIMGAKVEFKVDLELWCWRPRFGWNGGCPYFMWLCFRIGAELVFEWRNK